MFAHRPRRGPHPRPAAPKPAVRLHQMTAAIAAVICGLLAPLAIIRSASAAAILIPDPGGAGGPARPTPVPPAIRVVTAGGMAGWQIALIALGAALVAAAAAVLLDRALAARRAAPAPTATGHGQPRPDEISSPPARR
jgi:hypothetical protein